MPKSVEWVGTVKTKKTGNTMRRNGKWTRGKYLTFSIAIPSEQARELGLVTGTRLLVKATPRPQKRNG